MLLRIVVAVVCLIAAAFLVGAATGCTVHFKASDLELDSQSNTTYRLQSMSLFDGEGS